MDRTHGQYSSLTRCTEDVKKHTNQGSMLESLANNLRSLSKLFPTQVTIDQSATSDLFREKK